MHCAQDGQVVINVQLNLFIDTSTFCTNFCNIFAWQQVVRLAQFCQNIVIKIHIHDSEDAMPPAPSVSETFLFQHLYSTSCFVSPFNNKNLQPIRA